METGVDTESRGDDELTPNLDDVIGPTEDLELGPKMDDVVDPLTHEPHEDGDSMVLSDPTPDPMGLDENREKQDNKNYREGPWDVLEMLVLVSAMKEYTETVASHHAQGGEFHEQHKWHWIENYCWGQLVHRSVPDCHEKWVTLSGEFKRIKDFESNMLHDQKSYWEMTYDERNGAQLPTDFSQEVYNALWQWEDRDRIGDPGNGGM